MKLFGNGGGSWGLTVLETDPDFGTSRALFGICGDSGTGSVWILLLFMNFTVRHETD